MTSEALHYLESSIFLLCREIELQGIVLCLQLSYLMCYFSKFSLGRLFLSILDFTLADIHTDQLISDVSDNRRHDRYHRKQYSHRFKFGIYTHKVCVVIVLYS